MRPLLRSALRVWTKRPAGPLLLALGVLFATVLASGTQLALDGAREAEQARDRAALGDRMATVRTPGGYSLAEGALDEVQTRLADTTDVEDPARRLPVFLERDAIVTTDTGSSADWRVLGLPEASLQALGLPVPGSGQALAASGGPTLPADEAQIRVPQAPQDNVTLTSSRGGQLEQTTRVGDDYQHAEGDEYRFDVPVREGAIGLDLALSTADNGTDFDLEATSPTGETYLDDEGTAAEPVMPRIQVEDPAAGNWTVEVHAKFAREVAFRLEIAEVFDARDAQTLGRLLEGEGFAAIGAQLGVTDQAQTTLSVQPTDLDVLGPGSSGLLVLTLEDLQTLAGTGDRADGLYVMAGPGEDVLDGLDRDRRQQLTSELAGVREQAPSVDPLSGIELATDADDRREQRRTLLDSTSRLLFVVLPAGVAAGVLLATWAAGLHTRRLASEIRVMAALGQSRLRSLGLVAAHLGPPFVVGAGGAVASAPLVGAFVASGLGLSSAPAALPGLPALLVPLLASAPVSAAVGLRLRGALEGQDPRVGDRPPRRSRRWLAAGGWAGLAGVLAGAAWLATMDPARTYLLAALAGCAAGLAVIWAPLVDAVLDRVSQLSVANLGWYRTRSTHPQLGLAAATAALVLAGLLAGTALSQAASPDPELESGGYPVLSQTSTHVTTLEGLAPEDGPLAQRGNELASTSLGTEFLMRVEGTGLHSADNGDPDRIYGIDRSFAQRHEHQVEPVGGVEDPFRRVAEDDSAAVVSRDVWEALDQERIFVQGTQGRLPYDVVGIVDTRVLEGVYLSQEAVPAQFAQIAGEQRFILDDGTDREAFAEGLQAVYKDAGLRSTTAQALVDEELAGQQRAGATLSAMASLGLVTALLLVVLMGVRARAERRTSDAVLVAQGASTRDLAAGIAIETAMPFLVGALAGLALVPVALQLDQLEGLAFPLLPIEGGALLVRTGLVVVGVLAATVLVSAVVGVRAVRGLDQQALRELE
ncbi:hypothetical protein BRD56_05060 [Thermoplasmatales archaeon SW_10_69_26]|nr:MAG: hypothetical protein BRD56_05060 [Thermoplasmatales archaeon SW_10_69_26]